VRRDVRIFPDMRSRTTIPRATPSATTRSSISWCVYISTLALGDLLLELLVRAEEELLAGLPRA
jgi:hypothetical protein